MKKRNKIRHSKEDTLCALRIHLDLDSHCVDCPFLDDFNCSLALLNHCEYYLLEKELKK